MVLCNSLSGQFGIVVSDKNTRQTTKPEMSTHCSGTVIRASMCISSGDIFSVDKRLLDILVCPVTKGKLILNENELWSTSAGLAYPVRGGIPVLYEAEARQLSVQEIELVKDKKS